MLPPGAGDRKAARAVGHCAIGIAGAAEAKVKQPHMDTGQWLAGQRIYHHAFNTGRLRAERAAGQQKKSRPSHSLTIHQKAALG